MKTTIKISLMALLITVKSLVFAQNARFVNSGTIEFEKKVNMHAMFKKRIKDDKSGFMQQAYDQYIKNKPQFKTIKNSLSFSKDKTLYKTMDNEESNAGGFFGDDQLVNLKNIIFTDLSSNSSISQKQIYEETYLVKDSTRKINWKITDETRTIAGFECRRANAVILDSIYVVAFYTNEILPSGGPESFTGLPGMILGVALPHENMTWFATKVTDTSVPITDLVAPKKGKTINNKELRAILQSGLKNWGDYAKPAFKAFLL